MGDPADSRHHRQRHARNWLDDEGFLLVDTPIITPAAGEETTTLFDIDYFGEPAFLAQTGQLYNEANIAAFGKVYCFGPDFRARNRARDATCWSSGCWSRSWPSARSKS